MKLPAPPRNGDKVATRLSDKTVPRWLVVVTSLRVGFPASRLPGRRYPHAPLPPPRTPVKGHANPAQGPPRAGSGCRDGTPGAWRGAERSPGRPWREGDARPPRAPWSPRLRAPALSPARGRGPSPALARCRALTSGEGIPRRAGLGWLLPAADWALRVRTPEAPAGPAHPDRPRPAAQVTSSRSRGGGTISCSKPGAPQTRPGDLAAEGPGQSVRL